MLRRRKTLRPIPMPVRHHIPMWLMLSRRRLRTYKVLGPQVLPPLTEQKQSWARLKKLRKAMRRTTPRLIW